jgi:hypothetical protein
MDTTTVYPKDWAQRIWRCRRDSDTHSHIVERCRSASLGPVTWLSLQQRRKYPRNEAADEQANVEHVAVY